jgi:hypothetical protein
MVKYVFQSMIFFAAALMAFNGQAARIPASIVNHENIAIQAASGKALTQKDVRSIILAAGAQTKPAWQFNEVSDNHMVGSFSTKGNKHMIVVDITYAADRYSIRYKSSVNMNYQNDSGTDKQEAGSIHPNYNRWVSNLIESIKVETFRR